MRHETCTIRAEVEDPKINDSKQTLCTHIYNINYREIKVHDNRYLSAIRKNDLMIVLNPTPPFQYWIAFIYHPNKVFITDSAGKAKGLFLK